MFLRDTDARLTLYLRRASRLGNPAAVIEASDLEYTILRPGWFTRDEEVSYQVTQKGEPFRGHDVSLDSVSDLIVKLAGTLGKEVRRSLGVAWGDARSGSRSAD